jgi:hypothetical protein
MVSVAMGGERGLVVVYLEEEHMVWTIGHHEGASTNVQHYPGFLHAPVLPRERVGLVRILA